MKLVSRRFEYGDNFTISRLSVDGVYECYVLEDVVRPSGVKVDGQTAIPAGTYSVVIDFSNRFNRDMPHILDVPMFAGIRIHSGNTDADTEGCLLLGRDWVGGDDVMSSHVAFDAFFPKLQAAVAAGDIVTIEIQDTK
jgi:hypothetical protein